MQMQDGKNKRGNHFRNRFGESVMSAQERKTPAPEKPVYLTVDEVAELMGCACLPCQKKLYLALGEKAAAAKLLTTRFRGPLTALEDELQDICRKQGVETGVLQQGNTELAVHVRRLVSRRARELGYSYPEIGRFLGRHHTAVMHLVLTDGHSEKRSARKAAGDGTR
jgi:hypothetical protein